MTLLAPWAVWFAAIGAAVVALYLLKIKRRRQTVPALDFWLQLAGRTRVHSLFQRLKRLLSMLLWLAAVACLVLALGNPILSLGRIKPRAIAVIIDNSSSMQALEPDQQNQSRLVLAQRAVEDLITRRPVTDQWLLIEAARQPRVLAPWTYDTKAIRTASTALAPFAGRGDLSAAVELAGELLVGKPDPCIVIVSDGAAGAIEPLARADPRIVYWPIGRTRNNLGITRLAVRPHRQHGNYLALISVANASDQKIDTQLTLQLDGRTHAVELVSVEPGATWEKTITIDPPAGAAAAGAVLRASLDRPDDLPLDNEAFAILPPIRPAVVWLVTPPDGAFFFEQALASMDELVSAEESLTLAPDQFAAALSAAMTTGKPGQPAASSTDGKPTLRPPDLVVFNGCAPQAAPTLPASGRFIFVNAWPSGPSDIPASVEGDVATPQLFLSPRPHPITEHIMLQGVRLAKARHVRLTQSGVGGAGATVLAHSPDGDPLIFLVEQASSAGDRRSLCLAFDVLESDIPFRNAFPLLLRNAVAYMHSDESGDGSGAGGGSGIIRSQYQIGEPVRPLRPVPAGIAKVAVGLLTGGHDAKVQDRTLPVADSTFVFTDTARAGALRLTIGDQPSYAAINIGDSDESRIGPIPAATDPSATLGLSRRLLGFGGLPWVGLAAAALSIVVLEWLTYHLRWTE